MRTLLLFWLAAAPLCAEPFVNAPAWFDEFEGQGPPETARWGYDLGGGGWGNQELQVYTDRNAWRENGHLVLEARREPDGSFTSCRLVSKGKGDFTYGKWVIRARLPRGKGTWPAIWMLPSAGGAWPDEGEIDIMEEVGHDPEVIHGSIHCRAFNHIDKTQKTARRSLPGAQSEFHDYVLRWTPDRITTSIDDGPPVLVFDNLHQTRKEWPFDRPFHLLLNIAVGGFWGGAEGVAEDIWPQRMEVDYVRYYPYQQQVP